MKRFKAVSIFIFVATFFIAGLLVTFSLGLGKPPQTWYGFAIGVVLVASCSATMFTYFMMVNPDWNKSKEELDQEKFEFAEQRKELLKLRKKYELHFETFESKYKRAAAIAITALESVNVEVSVSIENKMPDGKNNGVVIKSNSRDVASNLRADIGYLPNS